MIIECVIIALGLLCFDGTKSPDSEDQTCKIEREMGYMACMDYPNCNVHGWNLAYISESYVKEKNVKWCEQLK